MFSGRKGRVFRNSFEMICTFADLYSFITSIMSSGGVVVFLSIISIQTPVASAVAQCVQSGR